MAAKYKCEVCDKTFLRKVNLRNHSIIHTGLKPYRCDSCPKSFARSQELKLHKNYHLGIKPFKCKQCSKEFSQPAHLKAHTRTHTGEKPYRCDLCPKTFTQSSHLRTHRFHHTGEKPHKCPHCDARFRLSSTLKCHLRRHTGEKPYKCHICGLSFSQTTPLYHHLQKHTGKFPFKCKVCGKRFRIKKICEDHENTACRHGASGISAPHVKRHFQCVFCKERKYTQEELDRHLRQHFGENPYFCRFCDLSFLTDKARAYHMRIHVNVGAPVIDKPFKCNLCHHSFKLEDRFKRHMSQNHLNDKLGEKNKRREELKLKEVKTKKSKDKVKVPDEKEEQEEDDDDGGRYYCEHCNASYLEEWDLKQHKINYHLIRSRGVGYPQVRGRGGNGGTVWRKKKKFECKFCDNSFEQDCSLQLHVRIVHEGLVPRKCDFCWKSFPSDWALSRHLREAHGGMKMEVLMVKREDEEKEENNKEWIRTGEKKVEVKMEGIYEEEEEVEKGGEIHVEDVNTPNQLIVVKKEVDIFEGNRLVEEENIEDVEQAVEVLVKDVVEAAEQQFSIIQDYYYCDIRNYLQF